jgi:hypothetical protein
MRRVPGLELIAKGFMGPAAEQVLLLENIATSVKIGPDQLPSVHRLLQEAVSDPAASAGLGYLQLWGIEPQHAP